MNDNRYNPSMEIIKEKTMESTAKYLKMEEAVQLR